jgi:hypothetical protein
MDDYMTPDDWTALARLDELGKRGLAVSTISAAEAAKLSRRGFVAAAAQGAGLVITASGKTAIENWKRSRRI